MKALPRTHAAADVVVAAAAVAVADVGAAEAAAASPGLPAEVAEACRDLQAAAVIRGHPVEAVATRAHLAAVAAGIHVLLVEALLDLPGVAFHVHPEAALLGLPGAALLDLRNCLPAALRNQVEAEFLPPRASVPLAVIDLPSAVARLNCPPAIGPALAPPGARAPALLIAHRNCPPPGLAPVLAPERVRVQAQETGQARDPAHNRASAPAKVMSAISSASPAERLPVERSAELWVIAHPSFPPNARGLAIAQESGSGPGQANGPSARNSALIGVSAPRTEINNGSSVSTPATMPGISAATNGSNPATTSNRIATSVGISSKTRKRIAKAGATRIARTGSNIAKIFGTIAEIAPRKSGTTPAISMTTSLTIAGGATVAGELAGSGTILPIPGGGGRRPLGAPSPPSWTLSRPSRSTSTTA